MLDLARFSILSFDCYGTLIDWETGILRALKPVLARHGCMVADGDALTLYARAEAAAEKEAFTPYKDVLRRTMDRIGRELGFEPDPLQREAFVRSLPNWQPFADTVDALRALAARFELAVISNVDDDLFARTRTLLQAPFAHVVTAQQVGAYKPSTKLFETAAQRFGVAKPRWLHVAQSLYHDVAPARAFGLATVHVDRGKGKHGSGATPAATAIADLTVPDLASLARLSEG